MKKNKRSEKTIAKSEFFREDFQIQTFFDLKGKGLGIKVCLIVYNIQSNQRNIVQ